jgi:hypothetical protein
MLDTEAPEKFKTKASRMPMLAHTSTQDVKKTPPEANASTQIRRTNVQKSPDANARFCTDCLGVR